MAEPITEPWTYTVDGVEYEGRRVWHRESPGPIGCGIWYMDTKYEDVFADDGKWERHTYAWEPCDEPVSA